MKKTSKITMLLLAVCLIFTSCLCGLGTAQYAFATENELSPEELIITMTTSPKCDMGGYTATLQLEERDTEGSYNLIIPDYAIWFSTPGGTTGKSNDQLPVFTLSLPENSKAYLKANYNQVITEDTKVNCEVVGDEAGKVKLDSLIYNKQYDEFFTVEIIPDGETEGKVYKLYIKPQATISNISIKDQKGIARPFERIKTYKNYQTIHPAYKAVTTDAVAGTSVTIVLDSYSQQLTMNAENRPTYSMKINGEPVELKISGAQYICTYTVPEVGKDTSIECNVSCEGYATGEPVTVMLKSSAEDSYPQIGTYTKNKSESGEVNAKVQVSVPVTNTNQEGFSYLWEIGTMRGFSVIEGQTTKTCQIDTTNPMNGALVRCTVTNTVEDRVYSVLVKSLAKVTIAGTTPKPTITTEPESATYEEGQTVAALSVTAKGTIGGNLSYQWYQSDADTTTGGKKIAGATKQTYTPTQTEVGPKYYYCKIKDTLKSFASDEITSAVAKIEIIKAADFTLSGEGTESNPYLIRSYDDLKLIRKFVNERGATFANAYFRLMQDITLSEDWTPIGTTKDGTDDVDYGRNINPFSGILDGKDGDTIHTVTVADGGLPLFNYVRSATIKNLNIKGKIAGYGLINKYAIDYGEDGNYQTGCPETVTIDNVTLLEGTETLYSGFIGGFASGANTVTIVNCVAEKGVVIGYTKDESSIGTFAGSFNGIMINCKSAADVYGTSNVGGLIGAKGQSMGSCKAANCEFSGNVYATGRHAGGIIGSGYDGGGTAPNTPVVTIQNCLVSGNITGADRVGGLLGAEPGCENCWANGSGSVTDSVFCGTVSATEENTAVGAIVGFLKSYNKHQTVGNNYFLDACGAPNGIGEVEIIKLDGFDIAKTAVPSTAKQMQNRTVVNALNASSTSFKNWLQGSEHPVLSSEPVAYKLTLSGEYKTDYYVGESLNTDNMVITRSWSDGKQTTISPEEAEISGFTTSSIGIKTVKVKYGVAEASFEIRVTKKTPEGATVYLTIYGDSAHENTKDASGTVHTLRAGNLKPWVARTSYSVTENTTVKDVLQTAARKSENGITLHEKPATKYGYYLEGMTRNGEYLGEFTNGKLSGWMYTVNGSHPDIGMGAYFVKNGDNIIVHYTDDYTKEEGSDKWGTPGADEVKDVTTSGAAGAASTTAPTEVKVSGSTATATVKAENQSEIIKQAVDKKSTEIILEVSKTDSKGADSVQLSLEVSFVKNVVDKTDADLTVNTEHGKVTLDQETMKTVLAEAKGATITLEVTKVAKPTEVQKQAAGTNGHLLKLTIKSGDKVISDFNKGKVKVVAEIVSKLLDKKVAAIHIADDGKIEQLAGKILTIGGKKYYEFTTPHFSTFALVDAEELGLEVEEPQVDAKALAAKLTPVARSAKTAKKNVKVTVSLDKQDKAIIKELKDAGYTVKYRFYRSTKKTAGYKAAVTKKTAAYTNTGGKKGTKYYYKVQVRVYDENGKLAAKTALKQCKYASRTWSKAK